MNVYILDKDLNTVFVLDAFTSLIWDMYYNDKGGGELYLPVSPEALQYITDGAFVVRPDTDRVCRVISRGITTDAENGDYIIATLEAAEGILAQRIVWTTETCNGKLEPFIHKVVDDQLGSGADESRQISTEHGLLIQTGTLSNLTATSTEQVTYANLMEQVFEWCKREGWGVKLEYRGTFLRLTLYAGTDRSNSVFFSDEYGNLISTEYTEDESNLGNVAVVAGAGQGSERLKITTGAAEGADRYEKYIDARDLSREVTYEDLIDTYPGGTIIPTADPDVFIYRLALIDIPLLTNQQRDALQIEYPQGGIVYIDGKRYFEVEDADIAKLATDTPQDTDTAVIEPGIYYGYLTDRGLSNMSEFGPVVSFTGAIEPTVNFEYGRDYFLGDIVRIQNEYGISVKARIIEVTEVWDDTGYNVTPNFEIIGE